MILKRFWLLFLSLLKNNNLHVFNNSESWSWRRMPNLNLKFQINMLFK